MELETVISNHSVCEDRYSMLNPPVYNSEVNHCAGGNGKSICNGDSGGPLVVKLGENWYLAGITSWVLRNSFLGKRCYDGGVFAKASSYVNWIKENTESKRIKKIYKLFL